MSDKPDLRVMCTSGRHTVARLMAAGDHYDLHVNEAGHRSARDVLDRPDTFGAWRVYSVWSGRNPTGDPVWSGEVTCACGMVWPFSGDDAARALRDRVRVVVLKETLADFADPLRVVRGNPERHA